MRGLSGEQAAELLADLCSMPFDDDKINKLWMASRTDSEFKARFAAILIKSALYAFCSAPQMCESREKTTSLAARFDSELEILEKRMDELEQASGYKMMQKKRIQMKAAFAVREVVCDLIRTWGELYFADGPKPQHNPQP